MSEPVSFTGQRGAGVYGRESVSPKRCGRCNNGTGVYNPACSCRLRPDDRVSYMEPESGYEFDE